MRALKVFKALTNNGPMPQTLKAAPLLSSGIRSAIVPPLRENDGQPARPIKKRNAMSIGRLVLSAHAIDAIVRSTLEM